LIPLHGDGAALRSFADRALRSMRICSSVVGPADLVLDLWEHLEYGWGPARAIRESQPLMALTSVDRKMVDSAVRLVRREELELYLPAAVAMFKEEIGTDPTEGDDGKNYRARVAELIDNQRAFARFENGKVVFKAEIGALSAHCGQIQGVWVDPEYRGRGLGTTGTGAVAAFLTQRLERTASLYVNSFNAPALAAYRKLGFRQVGQYATVLL
jgi:predicted GNAT family acetyltransferase